MLLLFTGDNAVRDTFRLAEEIAHFGLWQVDLATGAMTCSENMLRILGIGAPAASTDGDATVMRFSTLEQVTHPDDMPAIAEIQHIIADGLPFDRNFRVIHPNGRVRHLSIHGEVVVDASGRKSRAIGALMDVTVHAETMRASQVDSERVRAIMTAMDGRLWTARSDGFRTDLLLRSAASQQVPGTWLGFNWLTRVHPDDVARARAAWAEAPEQIRSFTLDLRVLGEDGAYHWRRHYCSPIVNDDGSVREWVGLSLLINQEHAAAQAEPGMLTGVQIRAARGILNWSVKELADRTGLSTGALRRIEAHDGYNRAAGQALLLIKDALSAAGVDFFVLPSGEAGVFATRKENRLKLVAGNARAKKV
ncbi:MAG: PAS domain-containing protein [Proteobacteria bacterium]|nr:PAS domain-containing protein [Pseudomonadota bacterium]